MCSDTREIMVFYRYWYNYHSSQNVPTFLWFLFFTPNLLISWQHGINQLCFDPINNATTGMIVEALLHNVPNVHMSYNTLYTVVITKRISSSGCRIIRWSGVIVPSTWGLLSLYVLWGWWYFQEHNSSECRPSEVIAPNEAINTTGYAWCIALRVRILSLHKTTFS